MKKAIGLVIICIFLSFNTLSMLEEGGGIAEKVEITSEDSTGGGTTSGGETTIPAYVPEEFKDMKPITSKTESECKGTECEKISKSEGSVPDWNNNGIPDGNEDSDGDEINDDRDPVRDDADDFTGNGWQTKKGKDIITANKGKETIKIYVADNEGKQVEYKLPPDVSIVQNLDTKKISVLRLEFNSMVKTREVDAPTEADLMPSPSTPVEAVIKNTEKEYGVFIDTGTLSYNEVPSYLAWKVRHTIEDLPESVRDKINGVGIVGEYIGIGSDSPGYTEESPYTKADPKKAQTAGAYYPNTGEIEFYVDTTKRAFLPKPEEVAGRDDVDNNIKEKAVALLNAEKYLAELEKEKKEWNEELKKGGPDSEYFKNIRESLRDVAEREESLKTRVDNLQTEYDDFVINSPLGERWRTETEKLVYHEFSHHMKKVLDTAFTKEGVTSEESNNYYLEGIKTVENIKGPSVLAKKLKENSNEFEEVLADAIADKMSGLYEKYQFEGSSKEMIDKVLKALDALDKKEQGNAEEWNDIVASAKGESAPEKQKAEEQKIAEEVKELKKAKESEKLPEEGIGKTSEKTEQKKLDMPELVYIKSGDRIILNVKVCNTDGMLGYNNKAILSYLPSTGISTEKARKEVEPVPSHGLCISDSLTVKADSEMPAGTQYMFKVVVRGRKDSNDIYEIKSTKIIVGEL